MSKRTKDTPNVLEAFYIERDRYDNDLQELRNETQTIEQEITALTADRTHAIETGLNDATIDALEAQIDERVKSVQRIKERIPALDRRKTDRLRAMLPKVEEYVSEWEKASKGAYDDTVRQLTAHKAAYLRTIAKVESAAKAVNVPKWELRKCYEEAGHTGEELPKPPTFSCGVKSFYNSYGSMDDALLTSYVIPEVVLRNMFDYGYIPKWAKEEESQQTK